LLVVARRSQGPAWRWRGLCAVPSPRGEMRRAASAGVAQSEGAEAVQVEPRTARLSVDWRPPVDAV